MLSDVVQEYAYGRSEHCIEEEDFRPFYHDAFVTAGRIGGLLKQMVWIYSILQILPRWTIARVFPELELMLQLQQASSSNHPIREH